MIWHDIRLALRSIQRNPFVSGLIIAVISVGIGSSVIAITLYRARAENPIWWKNDLVYRVLLDSRPKSRESDDSLHPEYPPFTLIYRDAIAVYESKIPKQSVIESYTDGLVNSLVSRDRPFHRRVRVTTHEFFTIFDVPFHYGHAWSTSDDEAPSQVAVISSYLNSKLFGGDNSLGRRISLNGLPFTVIGVLNTWLPLPRFYDEAKDYGPPDDVFIPFRWVDSIPDLSMQGFCLQTSTMISGFEALKHSDCLSSIGVWVELKDQRQYREFSDFLDNYSRAQRQTGRFERAPNTTLATVSKWLEMNDVVGKESKIQVVLALLFLAICVLNALALILAKFMAGASLAGLRRALGATRSDILRQHLIEVTLLGAMAGAFGVAFAIGGLQLIRIFVFTRAARPHDNPDYATIAQSLSHIDGQMLLIALALSLFAALLAGLYPAWRIGRIVPATFLKAQ
jgi:putative ABC transport system permease protein